MYACGIRKFSSGYGTVSISREYKPSEKILINYSFMRTRLNTPSVCGHLIIRGVMDMDDGHCILDGGTDIDKRDRFLQKLLKKNISDEIYDHFKITLKACQHTDIVNALENTLNISTDKYNNTAAISALNYLLIAPQNDILEGIDIHCLAIGCLENFVITLDEYIDVYNQHVCNRTKAGEMLIRAILKMPRLIRTISGFMKAMQAMKAFPLLKDKESLLKFRKSRNPVKVNLIRGKYPSLPSGTHESRCQMSITMNKEDTRKITNAIQNRHPELVYLFTKVFHALAVEANTGSDKIDFKTNTADLYQIMMLFIREGNEPLCQFVGDILFNCGVTQTEDNFFDISIECIPLVGSNNVDIIVHPDPAEVIARRGKMLIDVLYLEDFVVIEKLGAYLENTDDLIDIILELEKCDIFLEHIKATENVKDSNRIVWSGSFEGLVRGFRVNQEKILSIPKVKTLLTSLDPSIFDLQIDDDMDNDALRQVLLNTFCDDDRTDYKHLCNLYNELCNLGEYRVVDAIRNTGKLVANGTRTDVNAKLVLKSRRQMVEVLIDHTNYLGHGENYFDTLENLIQFVEKKQKLPVFFAHIRETVSESMYERITWFGTHKQLMKGFIANYDLLIDYDRTVSLLTQFDHGIVQEEEWLDMAAVDKRYTMITFLQHIFESGFECIAHLYDTLCNIQANDIVDQIRNKGTTGRSNDAPAEPKTSAVKQTVFTGRFKVYTI